MLMLMNTKDENLASDGLFRFVQHNETAGAEIMPYADVIGTNLVQQCLSDLKAVTYYRPKHLQYYHW